MIYQRLSPSTRRRLHQTIGEALEEAYAGQVGGIAAELAAHFGRSRDIGRAVRYHGEAAGYAKSRFAYQDACLHLRTALDLVRSQPETTKRLQTEMRLLHDFASTLFTIKGFGDDDTARAYMQMRELAERLDDATMQLQAMDGLLRVHVMRAELASARMLAERVVRLAKRLGNPMTAASGRLRLGATVFGLGEVEAAHHQAERARAIFDRESMLVLAISSRCLLASSCAHRGRIAEAHATTREAVDRAAALGIPYYRAYATSCAARLCALIGDVADARSFAEETAQLAGAYGFSVFRIAATMVRGWCDAQDRRVAEGLSALRGAFADYAATGQRIGTTFFGLLLAQAYLASGDVAGASATVDAALGFAADTGERVYEHELHRLKGACSLATAKTRAEKAAVKNSFQRALSIAGKRKALLFELRAATSLSQVCQKEGRRHLRDLVDRFGAADDCEDLRAARRALGAFPFHLGMSGRVL